MTNLSVTLNSTNTSLVADTINVIKEGWDAVGVNTTLNPQDTKALFSKLDGGEDYQWWPPRGIRSSSATTRT